MANVAERHADETLDGYAERVLRNEGRLWGLEQLVRETRESDRRMVEQRSDSLAQELERRADALLQLGRDERSADNREHRSALIAYQERNHQADLLLRQLYDAAIHENRKQSDEAIKSNEEHSVARYTALRQQVEGWRESDREARDLSVHETNRRLDVLNHADEKRQEFQSNAVTRELFLADKDAQMQREAVLRDQIIALDRTMLGMTPTSVSERAHSEVAARNDAAIAAASRTLDTKIDVLSEKITELKSYRDTQTGRSTGYTSVYGWVIGGIAATVSIITTVIIIANILTS